MLGLYHVLVFGLFLVWSTLSTDGSYSVNEILFDCAHILVCSNVGT